MSIYTPAGTGGPEKPAVDKTYINVSYNFMTPIDEDNTLYIWFQHRNTDPKDKKISDSMNAGAYMAFNEDKDVLEEVHKGMKYKTSPHLDLGLDAGAKMFRLQLQRLIDAETPALESAE